MINKPAPLSSRERVAKRRAALRAQGLRPKQFWVPDMRIPWVREKIRREAESIAASDREQEIRFAEAAQYWPEDDDA